MRAGPVLVVNAGARRKHARAIASHVQPRAIGTALDDEARTELLASVLAECLFHELAARREPPQVAEKSERPTADGGTQSAV